MPRNVWDSITELAPWAVATVAGVLIYKTLHKDTPVIPYQNNGKDSALVVPSPVRPTIIPIDSGRSIEAYGPVFINNGSIDIDVNSHNTDSYNTDSYNNSNNTNSFNTTNTTQTGGLEKTITPTEKNAQEKWMWGNKPGKKTTNYDNNNNNQNETKEETKPDNKPVSNTRSSELVFNGYRNGSPYFSTAAGLEVIIPQRQWRSIVPRGNGYGYGTFIISSMPSDMRRSLDNQFRSRPSTTRGTYFYPGWNYGNGNERHY
jgi:hypothetical protein